MTMTASKRARHVQDMVLAEQAGETIMYQGDCHSFESSSLQNNMQSLIAHPERYSIKKEPRVIYMNVYANTGYSHDDKASAEAAVGEDCLLIAHPIELPPPE